MFLPGNTSTLCSILYGCQLFMMSYFTLNSYTQNEDTNFLSHYQNSWRTLIRALTGLFLLVRITNPMVTDGGLVIPKQEFWGPVMCCRKWINSEMSLSLRRKTHGCSCVRFNPYHFPVRLENTCLWNSWTAEQCRQYWDTRDQRSEPVYMHS